MVGILNKNKTSDEAKHEQTRHYVIRSLGLATFIAPLVRYVISRWLMTLIVAAATTL